MSFKKLLFKNRSRGAILITSLILMFTSLAAVATALAVTNKTFENQSVVIKSMKRENIGRQTISIVEKWFAESINQGEIPAPKKDGDNEALNESPVYYVPDQILDIIIDNNSGSEIEGYVVDAYYKICTDEIDNSGSLFIEPHSFAVMENDILTIYNARHYFINVTIKLCHSDNNLLHINREIIVLRNKSNELSFVSLHSKKQIIRKTNK